MSPRLFIQSTMITFSFLACLGVSHAALADFQWVAPAAGNTPVATTAPAPPPMTALAPVPMGVPTVSGQVTSPPVVLGAAPQPVAPMPTLVPAESPAPVSATASSETSGAEIPLYNGSSDDLSLQPHAASPAPFTGPSAAPDMVPVQATSSPAPLSSPETPTAPADISGASGAPDATGPVVRGFAKNVPLVVALRQILPPGFAFSIDPNVDMKTKVSFQGGKPWRVTLRDTLAPAGLNMQETGQMVVIGYSEKYQSMAAPASTTPFPSAASSYQPGMAPQALQAPPTVTPLPEKSVADLPIVPLVIEAPVGVATDKVAQNREVWAAERGTSLHKVLDEWCRRVHAEFNWVAEYDYPVDASINFYGTFQEAVRSLLTGFENAHPQPVAELHINPGLGQMVLVVKTRGNTNSD